MAGASQGSDTGGDILHLAAWGGCQMSEVSIALSNTIESQGGYLLTRFLGSDGMKGRSLSAGLRRVKEVTETSMSPPGC